MPSVTWWCDSANQWPMLGLGDVLAEDHRHQHHDDADDRRSRIAPTRQRNMYMPIISASGWS
jgi:hypothetical protein